MVARRNDHDWRHVQSRLEASRRCALQRTRRLPPEPTSRGRRSRAFSVAKLEWPAKELVCAWREPAPPADGGRRNWAVPPPPPPKMICGTPVFRGRRRLAIQQSDRVRLYDTGEHTISGCSATGRRSAAYFHELIRARTRRRFGFDFSEERSLSKPIILRFRDALTDAWMCATSSGRRSSGASCITRD